MNSVRFFHRLRMYLRLLTYPRTRPGSEGLLERRQLSPRERERLPAPGEEETEVSAPLEGDPVATSHRATSPVSGSTSTTSHQPPPFCAQIRS